MPTRKNELTLTLEEVKLLSPMIERYVYKHLPTSEECKVISKINEFIIDSE